MSATSSVASSGPNSTLSMLQAMARSWQTETQDQITSDITSLKNNASSMARGSIFIGQTSSSKLTAAIIQTGLGKGGTADDENNAASAQNWESKLSSLFTEQHSMSSKQISDLIYSGGGLSEAGSNQVDTFSSMIQQTLGGDHPNTLMATQLNQALATHTLTIEKASDVAGLDYHQTVTNAASEGGGVASTDESWNMAFTGLTVDSNDNYVSNVAGDGKRHTVLDMGYNLTLYLSW